MGIKPGGEGFRAVTAFEVIQRGCLRESFRSRL